MLEIGSGISASTYDRQYVARMALFNSSAGQLDERGWTEIVLRVGTTVGDLREAANELYGLDSENLILVKVDTYNHMVEEFLMPDDTSLRASRPGIYAHGALLVARDQRLEGGKSKVAALKAALSEAVRSDELHNCNVSQHASDNLSSRKISALPRYSVERAVLISSWITMQSTESQVFFSDVGGSTYDHKRVVPSDISISALTAQVAAVLGKPSDEIKLYASHQSAIHSRPHPC
jgi:hypothetical protein